MFSLRLYDEVQGSGVGAKAPTGRGGKPTNNHKNHGHEGNGDNDGDAITEAQRRYLSRILAERGLEGDDASNHLRSAFGIEDLNQVTKRDASSMIERLLEEAGAK
jgi:hypothetical protein